MTVRENVQMKLSKLRWHAGGDARLYLSSSVLLAAAETGIHFLLAAILAGGEVFEGSAPFGVAMVGASGTGICAAAALLGACLGYLTLLSFTDGLRYASAAILTFAVQFAFYDWKALRKPWAAPCIAGLMNGCTGFIYLSQGGWMTSDVIYFFTELALTVIACWCYQCLLAPLQTGQWGDARSPARRVGAGMLLCTVLIALEPVYVYRDISLGRALAVAAVLACAWQGGSAVGALVGVIVGLSMDFSSGGTPLYAMAFGLSALAAGVFRGRPRICAILVYMGSNAGAVLWLWDQGLPVPILYETLLGCLILAPLPRGTAARLGAWLAPNETGVAADLRAQQLVKQKLEGAAEGFHSLYETVSMAFRGVENEEDISQVYHRACGQVCRGCAKRSTCWGKEYVSTFNAMNDITEALQAHGRVVVNDFPAYFTGRCLHFNTFLTSVNREMTALLYRRQYNNRIRESRAAVARQYAQLSDLLGSAAAELSQELIPDTAAQRKLHQRLRAMHLPLEATAFRDGRGLLRLEVFGAGCQALREEETLQKVSAALGVPLQAEGSGDSLTLIQQEPLMAIAGMAARKKDGETVSGDVGTYFKAPNGTLFVLLCDGMGSGTAAKRESSLAVRLLGQFLQAGIEPEHALSVLSSALALRGEASGGFTTVDLLQVDLFTGRGAVYKLGAAPSYLKRGTQVQRITGSALPAGLAAGEAGKPDKLPVQLAPGDCVLLVSDGITGSGDDSWLRERLTHFNGKSPKELARELVAQSPQGATDDRTALLVRIQTRR